MAKKQQKFLGLSKNIWIWAGVGYLGYMIFRPRLTQTTTTSGGTVTPPPTRTTTSGDGLSTAPTVDGIYIGAVNKSSIQKRVDEINQMIEIADGDYVYDYTSTWQSNLVFNPLKYTNGVLYVSWKEQDYKGKWVKTSTKYGEYDIPEVLTWIRKMYKTAIKYK
jgi:hypothetical protein